MTTYHRSTFAGIYGITINPIRLIYMMGFIWRLSQHLNQESIQLIEIGSWCGSSTLTWGESISQHFRGLSQITCIDSWQPMSDMPDQVSANLRAMNEVLIDGSAYEIFLKNLKSLPNNIEPIVYRGLSSDILPALSQNKYDIIYIDGDHRYSSVLKDIQQSLDLIRDGGFICGDDLEIQLHECKDMLQPFDIGLFKNIDELYHESRNTYYHPGVTLAVAEVLGPVMTWNGFWATQVKCKNKFDMSLTGMPLKIPLHIPSHLLIALKRELMGL